MFSFDLLPWLFCIVQLTLIGGIVVLAGRILIRRAPDIASVTCAMAMIAGSLLVASNCLDVPKPWTISAQSSTHIATAPQRAKTSSLSEPTFETQPTESSAASGGLSLATLLSHLEPILARPDSLPHGIGKFAFHMATLLAVLLLVRLGVGVFALIALRRRSRVIECDAMQKQIAFFLQRLNLNRKISIRQCSDIDSPCVSWLSPTVIFVPHGFESWSQQEQHASLAHELGHLKCRDPLWRLACELAWTFVCWHPLMWKVRQQLVLAQEISADQLAVRAQGSRKQYQQGLSLLALRLDCDTRSKTQSIYFLGMSVSSSSLIRRIKMLQGLKTNEIKSSAGKRCFAIAASLLAFGWLSCWSVQAQTTEQSDNSTEPPVVRVAKNTTASPTTKAPFSRPVHAPWKSLGQAKGYLSVRVADLLEHPIHSKNLPQLWEQIRCLKKKADGTPQTLSDAGLPIDSITVVHSSLELHYLEDFQKQNNSTPDKQSIAWSVARNGIVVQTNKDVDWPMLIGDLDLSQSYPAAPSEELEEAVKKIAESATVGSELRISGEVFTQQPTAGGAKPVDSLARAIEGELWSFVRGGVVTVMSDFRLLRNEADADKDEELDKFEELVKATNRMLRTVAIGVEIGDANEEEFRMAIEPAEGTSAEALSENVKQLMKSCADLMEADDNPHIAHAMRQLEILVQESESGSFVTVTGRLPVLRLLGLGL